MKILITGANGQLGRELTKECLEFKNIELILTDIGDFDIQKYNCMDKNKIQKVTLDITNETNVAEVINEYKPDVVINCAAHTAVDKCENDEENAYKINALGLKYLAIATNAIGADIVQVSTDYVFDGDGNTPLIETDNVNPQTAYGRTKLQGEGFTAENNPKHYIVRTAWLYGDGNNFVKTMLKLSETNKVLKVVNDQKGTPTSTVDLAKVILKLVKNKAYGLYHCTCKGECTWYDFAKEIFKIKGIDTEVIPCTTDEFPRPAKRPKYSVLRNLALENSVGDITREWEESLKEYIKRI
ncbi:dTDP-4-dehydrorhamnose reductase [Haloimpatiens sp. FM7315]|uniref:dTDP-4-dehydrorhamnose reductase n=1 Tax=Haloimpatiens sp. FM7315 TaxID=3298609 RepID=UPI0035A37979